MKISSMPLPGKMASGVKWMTCPFNRRLPLCSLLERGLGSLLLCWGLPQIQVLRPGIQAVAQETVPIVPHIMAIVMAAGIMGTIIRTAASSAGMTEAGSHKYESFQSIHFSHNRRGAGDICQAPLLLMQLQNDVDHIPNSLLLLFRKLIPSVEEMLLLC